MAIERTPYGTWKARWRTPDGRAKAKAFKRKVDAEKYLAAVRTDLDRGTYIAPAANRLTVEAWAKEWLAGAHGLRKSSVDTYRRDLDRYILPAIGELRLARLTDDRINQLITDLEGRLSPSTVHRQYRTLRRMLNVAVKRRKLAVSPLTHVDAPRVPAGKMRFLTAQELDALAEAIDPRYQAWVLMAGWGGLRWSETVGLRRPNVDVERCRVHVVEQWVGRWEEPKSEASRRWVTLPTSLRPILERHLAEHAGEELVFPAPRGQHLGTSFRNRFWLPACRDAGLATVEKRKDLPDKIVGAPRIHDLRHTAVALAIAVGAHPKAIQARMGHSSITVTLDRYGHLFESLDADLAAGLDDLRSR